MVVLLKNNKHLYIYSILLVVLFLVYLSEAVCCKGVSVGVPARRVNACGVGLSVRGPCHRYGNSGGQIKVSFNKADEDIL